MALRRYQVPATSTIAKPAQIIPTKRLRRSARPPNSRSPRAAAMSAGKNENVIVLESTIRPARAPEPTTQRRSRS